MKLMNTMYEQVGGLVIKSTLLTSAWVFAQLEPLFELGLSKSLDIGFSVFLLFLFLIYMILENRNKEKKKELILESKDNLQASNRDLLLSNIESIHAFSAAIKDMAKSSERSSENYRESLREAILSNKEAIKKMEAAFEKLTDKL